MSQLDKTWSASSPETKKWLASIGFSALQLKDVAYVRVNLHSVRDFQLDADPPNEHALTLSTFNQADALNRMFITDFVVLFDDQAAGLGILGRKAISHVNCQIPAADPPSPAKCKRASDCPAHVCKDGACRDFYCENEACKPGRVAYETVDMGAQPVHSSGNDVVVQWQSTTVCEGTQKGSVGAWIGTLEDGAVRAVVDVGSPFETDFQGNDVMAKRSLRISGTSTPRDVAWGTPLRWNPALGRYQ